MKKLFWESISHHIESLVLLVVMFAWMISFCSAVSAEIVNFARGGDFESEEDMNQWSVWKAAGTAASIKIDNTTSAIGNSSLFVHDIVLDPNDKWKPLIRQDDVSVLEKDTPHTFSAFLKAEENRDVRVHLIDVNPPWHMKPDKIFSVGTKWEEYWITDVPVAESGALVFCNAPEGSDVSYWIDGVRFYEGEYQPTTAVAATGKLTTTWATIKSRFDR